MFKTFVKGYLIGLANIIPGVSGGTLALILGIYERLIHALRNVDMGVAGAAVRALSLRRHALSRLGGELRRMDAGFLCVIGVGAVAAILSTSRLMAYLLESQHAPSYAFFFGLVAVSMVFPYRHLRRKGWREVLAFMLAALFTVSLTFTVDEDKEVAAAEARQSVEQVETGTAAGQSAGSRIVSFETPGTGRLVAMFLAAALAISAMVLPGISGSFVLLLLGVYFDLLIAVNERQIIVVGVFALGALAGLLVFSRIMNVLLERCYNVTMAFMIGLMAGSLYVLWPFKKTVAVGVETLYLGNLWPGTLDARVMISVAACLVGAGIVLAFAMLENRAPGSSAGGHTAVRR